MFSRIVAFEMLHELASILPSYHIFQNHCYCVPSSSSLHVLLSYSIRSFYHLPNILAFSRRYIACYDSTRFLLSILNPPYIFYPFSRFLTHCPAKVMFSKISFPRSTITCYGAAAGVSKRRPRGIAREKRRVST